MTAQITVASPTYIEGRARDARRRYDEAMPRLPNDYGLAARMFAFAVVTLAMPTVWFACTSTDPIPIPMPGDAGAVVDVGIDGARGVP